MSMLENLDPEQRKKLLLGLLLVLGLGYLGYAQLYEPRAQEVAALEDRLETLQIQNQVARRLIQNDGQDEVEHRLRLIREQLARVERLIPSSEELPDLLDAISAEAQRTGVELTLIQPAEAVQEMYYTRRTYSLGVLGSYHEIGEFLSQIGSLSRIISPVGLNITVNQAETRDGATELEARFSIETYVLPTEELPVDSAYAG